MANPMANRSPKSDPKSDPQSDPQADPKEAESALAELLEESILHAYGRDVKLAGTRPAVTVRLHPPTGREVRVTLSDLRRNHRQAMTFQLDKESMARFEALTFEEQEDLLMERADYSQQFNISLARLCIPEGTPGRVAIRPRAEPRDGE